MDFKTLLSQIDGIAEAANPAQQAAIAVNMKKHHQKPKTEGSMSDAEHNPRGAKFGGYWKGTQKSPPKPGQGVGGGESKQSLLKDFEQELKENPRRQASRDLMREYKEFIAEYGGVGGYGAASQAPQGSNQNPDPAQMQQQADQSQIKKSTNLVAPTLNAQGAPQQLDKTKFSDVMTKLDAKSNQELPAADTKQLQPLAVAASKALQNPQTTNQLKQVITKADQLDQQKQQQVKQAQQKVGTNAPAGQQQPQSTTPSNQPPAGATK